MKRRLGVITEDFPLFRKLQLLMREDFDTVMLKGEGESYGEFSAIVFDCDSIKAQPPRSCIRLSRDPSAHPGAVRIPFSLEKMRRALLESMPLTELLSADEATRTVRISGRTVKLTEVEAKLFFELYRKRDYVSREELVTAVWGEGADDGVLNVYVHYLREKLEKENERVILYSRKSGYRIDGRLLGDAKID